MIPVDKPTFTLGEWQQSDFQAELTAHDLDWAAKLTKHGITIEAVPNGIRVTTKAHVGVVEFTHFRLRIMPKLVGAESVLVSMLTLTQGINLLKRVDMDRTLGLAENGDLFDLLMWIFAEHCDRIFRQGVRNDYVEQEEELPLLRGRLLLHEQVRRRYGQIDTLHCRYDEFTSNVWENRLLLTALLRCYRCVQHPYVQRTVRQVLSLYAEVCTPLTDWHIVRADAEYHRLNDHYREAHELALLLLENMLIDDLLDHGQVDSFAFLLDMNKLFERLMERLFTEALRNTSLSVQFQRRFRHIISDAVTGDPYADIIPDILITGADTTFCVDAKYKLYDSRPLSPDDMYQSFFYAQTLGRSPSTPMQAIIVYPSQGNASITERIFAMRHSDGRPLTTLHAVGIHVPSVVDELLLDVGSLIKDRLLHILRP
jgi:5-methylcytosine-specific restriction enzyme subunit McrC